MTMPDDYVRRVARPARTYEDLQATFHHFDSERFRYLADHLRKSGRNHIAELADKWSDEHRQVARNLMRGRD